MIRGAISKINGDFVKKLRGEKRNFVMYESLKEIGGLGSIEEADYFGFSSWYNTLNKVSIVYYIHYSVHLVHFSVHYLLFGLFY